jgi:5-oxoprolinase (ATP-hydrolysing)
LLQKRWGIGSHRCKFASSGRVIPDYFPSIFGPNENEPLDLEATREAFCKLADISTLIEERKILLQETWKCVEEIALGFIDVANESMCRPYS